MSAGDLSEPVQHRSALFGDEEVALVDLLDRLLAGGVVLVGDITISLAGIDLVRVSLRALITSITPVERPQRDLTHGRGDGPRAIEPAPGGAG
jgi:hypothetical protein